MSRPGPPCLPGAPQILPRYFPPSKTARADLDVLCLTAMHKEPERRYRSVEALIRDVDHYLNGEPLEARPDALRYRMGKFVGRHRSAVAATALVFAVIVVLVAFFTVRLARARDAALMEAARTQRTQQFMMNLFQGGDKAAGPSDSLRVMTIVDRGVLEAKTLSQDPKVQAELYQNLGSIYQKLGKFDQADSLLQLALEQRKSQFDADSQEAAESLIAIGLLRSDQARLEDAEKLVRQGLEMTKRHVPANHPAVAKALASSRGSACRARLLPASNPGARRVGAASVGARRGTGGSGNQPVGACRRALLGRTL